MAPQVKRGLKLSPSENNSKRYIQAEIFLTDRGIDSPLCSFGIYLGLSSAAQELFCAKCLNYVSKAPLDFIQCDDSIKETTTLTLKGINALQKEGHTFKATKLLKDKNGPRPQKI